MGVTNFQSVISTQSVGTADVEKLAAAFDKLSGSIEKTGKKSQETGNASFDQFAAKVKQGIQDPLGAISSSAESALQALGPVGAGVAGIAAGFAAYATVAMSAARSLGHLGDEIEDTGVRMGLTNREVQQFQFAMKYAGGDMGTLEGIMRKLSQEIEGGGQNLTKIGVNFRDTSTGAVLPMSGIILELSEKLGAMTSTTERNAAAIKVLGKAGLAVLPDLLALREGVQVAGEQNLIFSDQTLAEFKKMHEQMVIVDAQWEFLTNKLKQGVAIPLMWIFGKLDTKDSGGDSHSPFDLLLATMRGTGHGPGPGSTKPELPFMYGTSQSLSQHRADAEERTASIARNKARIDAILGGGTDEEQLTTAKKKLRDLAEELGKMSGLEEQATATKTQEYAAQKRVVSGIEARIEATKKLKEVEKSLDSGEKQAREKFVSATVGDNPFAKILAGRLSSGEKLADTLEKIGPGHPELSERARAAFQEEMDASTIEWAKAMQTWRSKVIGMTDDLELIPTDKLNDKIEKDRKESGVVDEHGLLRLPANAQPLPPSGYISAQQQLKDSQHAEQRFTALFGAQAALAGIPEGQQAEILYQKRIEFANREYQDWLRIAETKEDKEAARAEAEDLRKEKRFQAEAERDQHLLELQLRHLEAVRNMGANFFDAALNGQKGIQDFFKNIMLDQGRKLAGNAAADLFGGQSFHMGLKPHIFQGTIFGKDPLKDVSKSPLELATDVNSTATKTNTDAINNLTAALSSARSAAMSPSGGGGGYSPAFSTFASAVKRVGGEEIGLGHLDALGLEREASGLIRRGPADSNIYSDLPLSHTAASQDLRLTPGLEAATANATAGNKFTAGKGVGMAAAGVGGAFGVYAGIKQGGAKGTLNAVSSGLMAAAMFDPEPISKAVLMAAGMATGLVSGILGDPKQKRKKEIDEFMEGHRFQGPEAVSIATDMYGRDLSYDQRGTLRPIVVNNTTTNNVKAIDSQDVARFFEKNTTALNRGMSKALDDGGDFVPKMAQNLGLQ